MPTGRVTDCSAVTDVPICDPFAPAAIIVSQGCPLTSQGSGCCVVLQTVDISKVEVVTQGTTVVSALRVCVVPCVVGAGIKFGFSKVEHSTVEV